MRQAERTGARRDDLFNYAVAMLNRLEEFDTPEMLKQTVDRLNQWVQEEPPGEKWNVDPLVAKLPKVYADLPVMKGLARREFRSEPPASDGMALQEAVLLRDVAKWARGDQVDDVRRAKCLFDWTVRNIQLESEEVGQLGGPDRVLQTPWETLLLGRGTAAERAWVFVLLARQQGLDAAVLRPHQPGEQEEPSGYCLVGVLAKGEIYLFDTELGLPVPARNGKKLDATGQLDVEPATLSRAAADEGLLRQLDVDFQHPYPLKASQLKSVVALLEASPAYLSQRMRLLESRLAGADKAVLSAAPSAQAARFRHCPHVTAAELWLRPYDTLLQEIQLGPKRVQWQLFMLMPFQVGVARTPALLKGRLYHLKGIFTGSPNAVEFYQMARLSNRQLSAAKVDPESRTIYLRAKLDASYWLGLIAMEQRNWRSAIDYLTTRTQQMVPNSLWTHGVRYSLARVYEASGRPQEAIQLYRADTESPGYRGNLLRARWLEGLTGTPAPSQRSTPPNG